MKNEMVFRGSRIAVFATIMLGSASVFAGQLYGPPIVDPALVGPVNDGGSGGHINNADPDGTWNTDASGNWSDTTKWAGGVIADGGGKADFSTVNTTASRTVTIDTTPRTVGRIDVGDTNNTNTYTFAATGGASLTFDNTANSANAQLNVTAGSSTATFNSTLPIILNSSLDITNASTSGANLSLLGTISAGTAGTKTITTSTGTVSVGGTISDGSGLVAVTQNGSGTLTLGTSSNTYSGGTTISGGGKISIGGSGTPLGTGTLTLSGGTLVTTGSRAAGATLVNNIAITADSAITTTSAAATNTARFSGTLTGSGGTLTIRNDASSTTNLFDVIFSGGDNTMNRPIILDNGASSGTVRVSDFGASGTTHTYGGVISGNGGFNRSSSSGAAGLTVFTAANTYTGPTTISNSTLQLGNGGTTGSLSSSSAITINTGGVLRFDRTSGADLTQGTDFSSSAITGVGQIIKDGTNSLTFNVANSFSGGLTINKGTVVGTVDGALGNGNISLTAGNITLTLNGASNNIADTATLSYVNTDTINLANTTTDTVAGLVVDGVSQAPGVYGNGFLDPDGAFFGVGTITVVPEPATWGMMLLGGGLLTAVRRFRRKQS